MFELSTKTKNNISHNVGLPFEEICEKSSDVSTSKFIKFSKKIQPGRSVRGNPYLSRKMFTTMEELDLYMNNMIKENQRG